MAPQELLSRHNQPKQIVTIRKTNPEDHGDFLVLFRPHSVLNFTIIVDSATLPR